MQQGMQHGACERLRGQGAGKTDGAMGRARAFAPWAAGDGQGRPRSALARLGLKRLGLARSVDLQPAPLPTLSDGPAPGHVAPGHVAGPAAPSPTPGASGCPFSPPPPPAPRTEAWPVEEHAAQGQGPGRLAGPGPAAQGQGPGRLAGPGPAAQSPPPPQANPLRRRVQCHDCPPGQRQRRVTVV